jgi:hypothetical protein
MEFGRISPYPKKNGSMGKITEHLLSLVKKQ